jgi:hypothetical protein
VSHSAGSIAQAAPPVVTNGYGVFMRESFRARGALTPRRAWQMSEISCMLVFAARAKSGVAPCTSKQYSVMAKGKPVARLKDLHQLRASPTAPIAARP